MNDTTKHYTHPALGINVYKDNMGYFAKLEKEAQAKLDAEKQKTNKSNNGNRILDFFQTVFLVLAVLNPATWMVYFVYFMIGSDDGYIQTYINMGYVMFPITFCWIMYFIIRKINK